MGLRFSKNAVSQPGEERENHSENLKEILDGVAKKYDDPVNMDRIERALQRCEVVKQEMRQVRLLVFVTSTALAIWRAY